MPKRSGPMPDTAEIIKLKGNPGHLTKDELEQREAGEIPARPLRPKRPADLSPYEVECWEMHVPELERLGLLSILDGGAFRMLCMTYAIAMTARDEMRPTKADGTPDKRKTGLAVTDVDPGHGRGVKKKHAAFMVFAQASRDYRAWAIEFGMTPSGRVSLRPAQLGRQAGPAGDDGDEDDAAFFGT